MGTPLHAKLTARVSTGVIISQDLWRKLKSRAVLVINQKFFAQFPNRFPGDLLTGTPPLHSPFPMDGSSFIAGTAAGVGRDPRLWNYPSPPIDK